MKKTLILLGILLLAISANALEEGKNYTQEQVDAMNMDNTPLHYQFLDLYFEPNTSGNQSTWTLTATYQRLNLQEWDNNGNKNYYAYYEQEAVTYNKPDFLTCYANAHKNQNGQQAQNCFNNYIIPDWTAKITSSDAMLREQLKQNQTNGWKLIPDNWLEWVKQQLGG